MKSLTKIILCSLLVLAGSARSQLASTNTSLTISFDFPTNALAIAQQQISTVITNPGAWPAMTSFWYWVYTTTNLAGSNTQWGLAMPPVKNPPPTTNADGSVSIYLSVPISPWQQNFFSIRSSNALGASFFSGAAATPLPVPTQPRVQVLVPSQ